VADGALAALMLPSLFALIFLGVPVGFALILVGAGFAAPVFGDLLARQVLARVIEIPQNFAFAAVPAFVLMGALLERAGLAEKLFAAMRLLLGRLPGGLALSALAMAAVFAACSGIIGAVEVVVGLMAMRPMLDRGYAPSLVAGTVAAGGSLGTIIPPSITAVVYGLVAQVPVNDLFAGLLLPGLLTVMLSAAWILLHAIRHPLPIERVQAEPLARRVAIVLGGLVPALLLIGAVLGAILLGVASPTEAAATGAAGAALLAALHGRLTGAVCFEALRTTALVTGMIMTIVVGGSLFAAAFTLHGGGVLVADAAGAWALPPSGLVTLLLAIVVALGFVLDWATIVLLCMPVFAPLLAAAGVEKLWFGVLMLCAIQTSYLTPPMAPAIFYVQSIAPPEIRYADIVRGVLPFLAVQIIVLVAVALFPALATALPEALRRF
jgi:tripartite ATP-independent transporter DctM subunit